MSAPSTMLKRYRFDNSFNWFSSYRSDLSREIRPPPPHPNNSHPRYGLPAACLGGYCLSDEGRKRLVTVYPRCFCQAFLNSNHQWFVSFLPVPYRLNLWIWMIWYDNISLVLRLNLRLSLSMLLMPEDVMQQPANRSIAPQNQVELQQSGFVAPPGTEIDHWIAGISVKLRQSQNVTKSCAASRLAASCFWTSRCGPVPSSLSDCHQQSQV